MKPWRGCDTGVANGLEAFASALTASHTLTSRRYSIWSLLRRHLDQPFAEAITSYKGLWGTELLKGFTPSTAWRFPCADTLARLAAHPKARRITLPAAPLSKVERVIAALECWEECVRISIHLMDPHDHDDGLTGSKAPGLSDFAFHLARHEDEAAAATHSEQSRFRATLDTVREMLRNLRAFRPRYGGNQLHGRLSDEVTRRPGASYCELCWRETMRSKALRQTTPTLSQLRLSNRFCEIHNPSDPRSRYRCDHRYKEAFQRELMALHGMAASAHQFRFHPPPHADAQEIRKTAYDLVHSGLRPAETHSNRRSGLRERVWALKRLGMHQAAIGRQLGISRQAVSKALKSLQFLVHAREKDAELSYLTGEPFSMSGRSGEAISAEMARMHGEGLTAAQIARRTGRLRHAVDAILRS